MSSLGFMSETITPSADGAAVADGVKNIYERSEKFERATTFTKI